eukprot:3185797-Heterocapsa_arctica.AAC.1
MLIHAWRQQLEAHDTTTSSLQLFAKIRTIMVITNMPSHRGCRTGDGHAASGESDAHRNRSDNVNPHKEQRKQGEKSRSTRM